MELSRRHIILDTCGRNTCIVRDTRRSREGSCTVVRREEAFRLGYRTFDEACSENCRDIVPACQSVTAFLAVLSPSPSLSQIAVRSTIWYCEFRFSTSASRYIHLLNNILSHSIEYRRSTYQRREEHTSPQTMFINIAMKSLLFLAGLASISSCSKDEDAVRVISEIGVVEMAAPERPPPECNFITFRDVCYSPIELSHNEKACVGVDKLDKKKEAARMKQHTPQYRERCERMSDKDFKDIIGATRAVVKEDKWLASKKFGGW